MKASLLPETLFDSIAASVRPAVSLAAAERTLLKQSLEVDAFRVFDVPIQIDGRPVLIHTLELSAGANTPCDAIVLVPGFGSGLALYEQVLASLSRYTSTHRVLTFDPIGTGGSTAIAEPSRQKGKHEHCLEVEKWFADALDSWRQALGIDRLLLVGHSLGSYHAISYSLRYPNTVKRLIAVSTAGLTSRKDPIAPNGRRFKPPDGPSRGAEDTGLVYGALHILWRAVNITPLHILRWRVVKPFVPMLVAKFARGRFGPTDEAKLRARYDYALALHTQPQPGSVFSVLALIKPGGDPVIALLPRLQPLVGLVPMTFVRGTADWVPSVSSEVAQSLGAGYHELPDVGRAYPQSFCS